MLAITFWLTLANSVYIGTCIYKKFGKKCDRRKEEEASENIKDAEKK